MSGRLASNQGTAEDSSMSRPAVVVSGATGMIGTALVVALDRSGYEVRRLVRRAPRSPGEFSWNPSGGTIDDAAFEGAEAVVNLAGETVGQWWTPARKARIVDSRVRG